MTTPIAYRIRDWNVHFENNKSRERDACSWCPIPNKQDGLGYGRLISMKNGVAMYGAFVAVTLAASKQDRPRDGYLTDSGRADGIPLTAADLAIMTKVPKSIINRMLVAVTSEGIGWVETYTPTARQVPVDCPPTALEGKGRKEEKEENRNERKEDGRREGTDVTVNNPESTSARRHASDSVSVDLKYGSEDVKRRLADPKTNPVSIALSITGESSNDRARGFLAKVRQAVGEVAFRQEVVAFAAEIASGEEPTNRGAALTARMSKLLEASK